MIDPTDYLFARAEVRDGVSGKSPLSALARGDNDPELKYAFIYHLTAVPTDSEIEAAINFQPEAKHVVNLWRQCWDQSFPNWLNEDGTVNKTAFPAHSFTETGWHQRNVDLVNGVYASSAKTQKIDRVGNAHQAQVLRLNLDRNHLHHFMDSAHVIAALLHCVPGMAFIRVQNMLYVLQRITPEGVPIIVPVDRRKYRDHLADMDRNISHYWNWLPVRREMKRKLWEAENLDHAMHVLVGMARAGLKKAFVKGASSKSGTWTIDLNGITTTREALARFAKVSFMDRAISGQGVRLDGRGYLIQEHLPFTHEQRFFVFDGRIVASVCSDRNFTPADTRVGKRLDDRLAVLHTPEIDEGRFDRGRTGHVVDRKLAADFAKTARRIVRELRDEGKRTYVLDLGLTERGITAIEVNGFVGSGPYCLDYGRVARAMMEGYRKVAAEASLMDAA